VSAENANGFGPLSTVSTTNALVSVLPLKPLNTPTRGASTSPTQIEVLWDAITSPRDGGEAIISYHLQWDQGTGTLSQIVVGDPTDFIGTSTLITSGIVAGTTYKFRYRVESILGVGEYSDATEIKAASAPDSVTNVVTAIENTYVKISWDLPVENSDPVTEYEILILTDDGTTYTASDDYCDGSFSAIILNRYCHVPMSVLTASPFDLDF